MFRSRAAPTVRIVRHITPERVHELDGVLPRIRAFDELTEKKPSTFYKKSVAFLHFHEDPAGLFADVKLDGRTFTRMRATDPDEQDALVAAIEVALRS